ncbi:hypothetical protein M8C21_014749, partial [Ambrosia artemisiifolia]
IMSSIEEVKHLHIPLKMLSKATNSFSNKNIIAKGGFGKVYKGVSLKYGNIAIKMLDPGQGQGDHEFKTEIALLSAPSGSLSHDDGFAAHRQGESRHETGQIVIPVFYGIEPSEVIFQTTYHLKALAMCELSNKVESWREALVEATNLSGWDADWHESKLIKRICDDISYKLLRFSEN